MYTTCLFCHASLGANDAIESFPVGRRLAFDAAQGRLWVVCRKCERWNLTPLEERWEAVEQCERLFTSTRLRVSTDNIGLSRLRGGLELVRVGKALRPEMAAWRYGDQFGRRRLRYVGTTLVLGGVAAGIMIAGPASGIIAGGGWGLFQGLNAVHSVIRERMVRTRVAVPGQDLPSILRGKDMKRIVIASDGERWSLRLPYHRGVLSGVGFPDTVTVTGDDALRVASSILPSINARGGKKEQVSAAVRILEATPDANQLFLNAAVNDVALRSSRRRLRRGLGASEIFLDRVPATIALALEMASHEDIERRSMEGELALLERAWREAEEIATISDSLLLPETVDQQYESMKRNPGEQI